MRGVSVYVWPARAVFEGVRTTGGRYVAAAPARTGHLYMGFSSFILTVAGFLVCRGSCFWGIWGALWFYFEARWLVVMGPGLARAVVAYGSMGISSSEDLFSLTNQPAAEHIMDSLTRRRNLNLFDEVMCRQLGTA